MADPGRTQRASQLRPHPSAVKVVSRERLLDDFFKIDKVVVSHQRFDGSMSPERSWLVMERGDSVAALLFDPEHRVVILVDQFRPATLGSGQGWLLETAAGMVRPEETPEASMIREIREETGYQVTELSPVATFYSSPGGTSERIFLYYAEVREAQQVDAGGGVDDGEDIAVIRMPLNEFLRRLRNREFEDPKIIIAGQWLRDRRQSMPSGQDQVTEPTYWRVVSSPGKRVGFLTGNIANVTGVDVWVNSENTDMMMDRFFDRSVSGTIRYKGAVKFPGTDRVQRDVVAEELRRALHGRNYVRPATVVDTTAGELERSNQVRRIFHVATVQGVLGQGLETNVDTLKLCIDNVLQAINQKRKYASVLIPMIGTGAGGYQVRDVAPKLVDRAVRYFESQPDARIERVLFLGYSEGDGDILADAMERLEAERRLAPDDAAAGG
jgi:nudix-type nucleoside diphosphatase (YffH/AdpP family)